MNKTASGGFYGLHHNTVIPSHNINTLEIMQHNIINAKFIFSDEKLYQKLITQHITYVVSINATENWLNKSIFRIFNPLLSNLMISNLGNNDNNIIILNHSYC